MQLERRSCWAVRSLHAFPFGHTLKRFLFVLKCFSDGWIIHAADIFKKRDKLRAEIRSYWHERAEMRFSIEDYNSIVPCRLAGCAEGDVALSSYSTRQHWVAGQDGVLPLSCTSPMFVSKPHSRHFEY